MVERGCLGGLKRHTRRLRRRGLTQQRRTAEANASHHGALSLR